MLFRLGYRRSFYKTKSQLLFQRGLKNSIKVSNPLAVWSLNLSKNILKGIFWFYGSAIVIGLTGYSVASYYIDEKFPKNWSVLSKIYGKLAIINQDFMENDKISEEFLIKCLKTFKDTPNLPDDKFQLLNLKELESKDTQWKSSYINMILRLAIIKFEKNDLVNSKKLLLYVINLPIDLGSIDLKSKGMRIMAKISKHENDLKSTESYLLDDLRYIEYYKSNLKFKSLGSNLISIDSEYYEEIYQILLELGKLYATTEKTKSLEIFINLLENFDQNSNFPNNDKSIKPMLKVYIGELLYSKGLIHKSIEWNLNSFNESFGNSKDLNSFYVTVQSLKNLIQLYKEDNQPDKAIKYEKLLTGLKAPHNSNVQSLL
ncbi:hypothetical protein WICMUC_001332 [Wickerhamomyces mucosus]|uniref:Uncharacterized protein n=1 Tax=Wickerhamomyces mucosus TaxID=1378264 RepID=A0A9P8THG3_9ASCO|nr:hypothetical protein WICMUC_001332 [Wickerhamomyces mucosus]